MNYDDNVPNLATKIREDLFPLNFVYFRISIFLFYFFCSATSTVLCTWMCVVCTQLQMRYSFATICFSLRPFSTLLEGFVYFFLGFSTFDVLNHIHLNGPMCLNVPFIIIIISNAHSRVIPFRGRIFVILSVSVLSSTFHIEIYSYAQCGV